MTAANSTGYLPQYVVIDLEGAIPPTNSSQFRTLVQGWVSGINTGSSGELTAALYANQYQWNSYDLNTLNVPGFVAISPISSSNPPSATGSNIPGFNGYYGTCVNGNCNGDVTVLNSFGETNSIQFSDSGDDCGP